MILYYKSDLGIFTVIKSTAAYNAFSNGDVINTSGNKTALYNTLAAIVDFTKLIAELYTTKDVTNSPTRYNLLSETGVIASLKPVTPPASTTTTDYPMPGYQASEKAVRATWAGSNHSVLGRVLVPTFYLVSENRTVTGSNVSIAYGYVGFNTSSSIELDLYNFPILISNDEGTAWKFAELKSGYNNQNRVYLWVETANSTQISILTDFFNNLDPYIEPTDPYEPGGHSGPGGGPGTGTFDFDSDIISLPPLPTTSFAATGFTRIYNPTLSELNALANYMWTDQTFLDTVINHLKQLLENPMDAVICLSLLPCSIPNGTPETVKVMYINTGVTMAPATTQFVEVDCGTYTIDEAYGSALDYNPYTKVHCYLPYIGQVTLDTDEVMGKTLQVKYRIDIVTGMCAAVILVNQNVLYQFSGHCAINMPINSADFSGYIGAAMTAGKMVAGVAAGAAGIAPLAAELVGAPAPHATVTHTMDTTRSTNLITNEDTHRQTERRTRTVTSPEVSFGEISRKAVANSVGAVMGSKLSVEHAGGFTGNSGYLAVRRPYLIIEHPRMCNPDEYGMYNGYPSMIYMSLSECVGYTEVQSIQFNGIGATNPELAELSELLKSGVIF